MSDIKELWVDKYRPSTLKDYVLKLKGEMENFLGCPIEIVEDEGKLVWECPKCGNRDQNKLNVARRTCGYIGTQFWNQGRTQEIKDRVLHL